MMKLSAIDLFCGAGGVTEGLLNSDVVDVIAAVNHSPDAIKAHKVNNPNTKHYQENIEDLDVSVLPQCDLLWASAECTHHSIAKGGQSRDADSRSLADYLDAYVIQCKPTYFMVENVKEFLDWCPVIIKRDKKGRIVYQTKVKKVKGKKVRYFVRDDNGKKMPVMIPDKTRKSELYEAWIEKIKGLGYEYKYQLINSADFGAFTSRTRYFGVFYRPHVRWEFPEPTHAKNPGDSGLKKWNACREKIKLDNEGTSIFGREYNMDLPKNLRRPLVEATQKRIAEGIKKFLLKDFIAKAYGGSETKSGRNMSATVTSMDEPLHTIPTRNIHAKVHIDKDEHFISKGYGTNLNKDMSHTATSVEEPLHTILTTNKHSLIKVEKDSSFIAKSYGAGGQQSKIDEPLHTITTKDRHALVQVEKHHFLSQIMHGSNHVMSVDEPARTIITKDEKHLITIETKQGEKTLDEIKEMEKRQFIVRHFSTPVFTDLDQPLGAVMTEKKDTLITVDFLCNVIKDIKMRYLDSYELADITGFKSGTYLGKNETQRKYHIGNAVPPVVPEHLALMAALCMEDSIEVVA